MSRSAWAPCTWPRASIIRTTAATPTRCSSPRSASCWPAVLKIGARINEAKRWFKLGPLSFQPVEIAKLGLVVFLAYSLAKKQEKVKTFTVGFMPHLAVCGLMMGLLLMQPDLGSALIIGATTIVMLFVAGAKISYLLLALMAAVPIAYHSVVATTWRLQRLFAYFDPWAHRKTTGYQITESLIAIGSGGWTGAGLGAGKQKLFLPEAYTVLILSNLGEELGIVGVCGVLFLFAVILWRGVRAAMLARDTFGTYIAAGLTTMFALQALFNTAVVLGAVPAKGITLPFVSYGGTSLVVSMFFAGMILNVSRRAPMPLARSESRLKNAMAENRKKRKPVRVVVA